MEDRGKVLRPYEKVLMVGEDLRGGLHLTQIMASANYHPTSTSDLKEAIALLHREDYEVVLLSVPLGHWDAPELCQRLRQFSDVPIMILTTREDVYFEVVSLESGADDYLTHPFPPEKLVSRVRALVRRARGRNAPLSSVSQPLIIGPLSLDFTTRKASLKGQELTLSSKEFLLLYTLAQNLGTLMSREQLMRRVWANDVHLDSKTLDVHIYRLRQKLEAVADVGRLLITIRKRGYMLSAELREA